MPTPTAVETPTQAEHQCPANCSDGNPCTADICSAVTDFQCSHDSLIGPQPGCSGDIGNCTEKACSGGACVTRPKVPCCGNGVCEANETCDSCPADCGCSGGELCCNAVCKTAACTSNTQCITGHNACINYVCDNPNTCSAACTQRNKTCMNGDFCCPQGCDYMTDNDCPAYSRGSWAKAKSNLSMDVDALFRRSCDQNGTYHDWLALKVILRFDYPEGSARFSPTQVNIIDSSLGLNMTAAIPPGDCYTSDKDYILNGTITLDASSGEITKLIYFYPAGRPIPQETKRVVITATPGERYIWLVAPQ